MIFVQHHATKSGLILTLGAWCRMTWLNTNIICRVNRPLCSNDALFIAVHLPRRELSQRNQDT
jgi:hypothetical protein